ncbi:hypothetical protein V7S43_013857 [Phytophthora oleae]|uniref:Secreted protein n=1 Tax=Phytophthora oleae TaxID=2107226 RepID=A0ABD3F374_9STRA
MGPVWVWRWVSLVLSCFCPSFGAKMAGSMGDDGSVNHDHSTNQRPKDNYSQNLASSLLLCYHCWNQCLGPVSRKLDMVLDRLQECR